MFGKMPAHRRRHGFKAIDEPACDDSRGEVFKTLIAATTDADLRSLPEVILNTRPHGLGKSLL
jgi:hypothetical protein